MRRHPWLTAAIVLVVLFGGVHFCLEWRAEQRWQRYAAAARARGVKLMLTDFAQPEIPDAQNFAMLPMMQKAFHGGYGNEGFKLPFDSRNGFCILSDEAGSGSLTVDPKAQDEMPDWKVIAKAFRQAKFDGAPTGDSTRDVLAFTEHYAPEIRQWSEWRQRPECRFPYILNTTDLYHYPVLKTFSNAADLFALRMHAHLALGDAEAAVGDFQEGMQAYHESRGETGMSASYYRMLILRVMMDAAGDGLRRRVWDGRQMQAIQAEIEKLRVWDGYRFALASERGAVNARVEALANASFRERGRIQSSYRPPLPPAGSFVAQVMGRRVFRNNQLQQNRYFDELEARVDPARPDIDFDGATPSSPQLDPSTMGRMLRYFSCVSDTDLTRIEARLAARQILLDQARLVCALERYRLAQGAYSATLTELVPQFITDLPRDPYARAPYHYQRLEGGTFLLYGVGANRQDDGGQINPNASEREQLDAIWLYAAPSTP
jgi:hypothetical protein